MLFNILLIYFQRTHPGFGLGTSLEVHGEILGGLSRPSESIGGSPGGCLIRDTGGRGSTRIGGSGAPWTESFEPIITHTPDDPKGSADSLVE